MKPIFVHIALLAILGFILPPINTWRFWAILLVVNFIIINMTREFK